MKEEFDSLQLAQQEMSSLDDKSKVDIKGKLYVTVATRVEIFRKHFGERGAISTDVLHQDDHRVVVRAEISIHKPDSAKWVLATGHAEEYRGDGYINKTSAMENCETSAVGRALSAAGLSGGEYASSFEVDNAINNKSKAAAKKATPEAEKAAPEAKKNEGDTLSEEDQVRLEKAIAEFVPIIADKSKAAKTEEEFDNYLDSKKEARDLIKELDPNVYESIKEKLGIMRKKIRKGK
jgi:hypothetical protein|tara:strand:- start:964 stop:1671 length:708 start_codon:yes stop_codon:yes gene_type:complete